MDPRIASIRHQHYDEKRKGTIRLIAETIKSGMLEHLQAVVDPGQLQARAKSQAIANMRQHREAIQQQVLAKQNFEFHLEQQVRQNHERNLQERHDYVMNFIKRYQKRVKNAEKAIAEELKSVRERLQEYFAKHAERKAQIKQEERAKEKDNDIWRKEVEQKYATARKERKDKEKKFLEEMYKKDQELIERVRLDHEKQY